MVRNVSTETNAFWMGAPDEIADSQSLTFRFALGTRFMRQLPTLDRVSYLLVYHWRGGHDFIFFACNDEAIIGSSWWFALE